MSNRGVAFFARLVYVKTQSAKINNCVAPGVHGVAQSVAIVVCWSSKTGLCQIDICFLHFKFWSVGFTVDVLNQYRSTLPGTTLHGGSENAIKVKIFNFLHNKKIV